MKETYGFKGHELLLVFWRFEVRVFCWVLSWCLVLSLEPLLSHPLQCTLNRGLVRVWQGLHSSAPKV